MQASLIDHPGPALLARETRVNYGPVPRELDGQAVESGGILLQGHRFLMLSGTGYGLFYCKDAGVIVERDPGADPAEEELWLNGSVYAAIAEINGFFAA
jgi:hypothetical protein